MIISATRITLLVGLILNLAVPVARAADDDPATAPIPDISDVLLDTRRAIYVEVSILTDGTTQLLESGVTNVPPAATDEEPALLLVELLDADGQVLGSQNAWDPRYQLYLPEQDDQDELVIVDEGIGVFQVLFDHRIARFRISDQQQDPVAVLADIGVQALVDGFCTDNPIDDNCEGFNPGPGDLDGDGVSDDVDMCANTIPESIPTSGVLGNNRWVLTFDSGAFTQAPPQAGSVYSFTLAETRGCSCEQIVTAEGLGRGQLKRGCSTSAMLNWIGNP